MESRACVPCVASIVGDLLCWQGCHREAEHRSKSGGESRVHLCAQSTVSWCAAVNSLDDTGAFQEGCTE